MLYVKTYIGPSKIHGTGLFAAEPIVKGAVVWRLIPRWDRIFLTEQIEQLPEHARAHLLIYGYVEKDKMILCGDNAKFINHSASPTIHALPGWDNDDVAVRDIVVGEELTGDYRHFDFREHLFT